MNKKIIYSLNLQDEINVNKFLIKISRINTISYFFAIIFIAFSAYCFIKTSHIRYIILAIIFSLMIASIVVYKNKFKAKKDYEKSIKNNPNHNRPTSVTFTENALEQQYIHEDGLPMFMAVYPYQLFVSIYESPKYFIFFKDDGDLIQVPKTAMTITDNQQISSCLSTKINYINVN